MEKPKIAFIDDEQRILRSLKMHFRQTHDVFTTTDPDELVSYVRDNDVKVVISDQRMPDKQGTEVLREVKDASPNTIRILLTGYADLNAVIDSVNEGEIYRYITKPWQNDELKRVVNKATEIAQQTKDIDHEVTEAVNTKGNRNVLVLDDDKEVYRQIKNHFEPNFKVSWASNLEEASDLLQRKQFSVAIADVTLNGDNIAPIVYALKNIQPDLMVLMLTEFKDAYMIIDLINKGQIYRCLPRPTNLTIMGISLERAYQHHQKMVQQPILAARHHVEEAPEVEGFNLSDKLKGFFSKLGISKLGKWRWGKEA
ncbi:response regulator [Psychrobacter pygoscelis]|uniref:response regulator n=1 Tax=Psychrobacter pygoscelis TaxID=2488563 RepID=UPI00103F07E5|nr:response regulator [Psychrobacter pygoscelis]